MRGHVLVQALSSRECVPICNPQSCQGHLDKAMVIMRKDKSTNDTHLQKKKKKKNVAWRMSAQRACFLSQTLMGHETGRRHNTASHKLLHKHELNDKTTAKDRD